MKGLICDPIDFVLPKATLEARTSKGIISIEDTGTIILATGNNGLDRIAWSAERNEKGLEKVKRMCRGFYSYERLNWNIKFK